MAETQAESAFDVIADTEWFQQFLDVQLALVEEARWHIEEDEISVCAVEPANVAMVVTSIDAAAFESYRCGDALLGINLNRLDEYVSGPTSGSVAHLTLDSQTHKLAVDTGPTSYTMALIDPESMRHEPDLPDLDLPATFGMEGSMLKNAVKAAGLVSDHLSFAVDPDERTLTIGAGGDTDRADTVLDDDDLLEASTGSEHVESILSHEYLLDVIKPIPKDGEVALHVGQELPAKIEYVLAEGHLSVTNLLAPRIQNY